MKLTINLGIRKLFSAAGEHFHSQNKEHPHFLASSLRPRMLARDQTCLLFFLDALLDSISQPSSQAWSKDDEPSDVSHLQAYPIKHSHFHLPLPFDVDELSDLRSHLLKMVEPLNRRSLDS